MKIGTIKKPHETLMTNSETNSDIEGKEKNFVKIFTKNEIKEIEGENFDMCKECSKKGDNVSVQIPRSKHSEILRAALKKHNNLSPSSFVSSCLSGNFYKLICDYCRMDIAEEQLFRESEEVSMSDEERDMLMTATRYSIKLKTGMITDSQMTELITAMTKVGGKLEFSEIPNSSIFHERAKRIQRRQAGSESATQSGDLQISSQTAQTTSQQSVDDEDNQTVITEIQTQVKDGVVEIYIDSFGNERPLDELRELIDKEEDFKELLESLRSPQGTEQQQNEINEDYETADQQDQTGNNGETSQSD